MADPLYEVRVQCESITGVQHYRARIYCRTHKRASWQEQAGYLVPASLTAWDGLWDWAESALQRGISARVLSFVYDELTPYPPPARVRGRVARAEAT